MAFKVYGSTKSGNSSGDGKSVDWDALNTHVVETAQLFERETLVGYISSIVDLGIQEQEDAEQVFTGTAEQEAEVIKEFPATYFKDGFDSKGKPARLKCWPQKAIQCVVYSVDFPDIIVDKGQFFGESNPQPLRLWSGGQFYMPEAGQIVARPIPLRYAKQPFGWSFAPNHSFYKMAVAAKLIKTGEPFLPENIDQLLGKSLQFQAQVYFKEVKGTKYYHEYLNFATGLGRSQSEHDVEGVPLYVVSFDEENPEDAIKNLRSHIINTIKRAANYESSLIKKQIEKQKPFYSAATNEDSSEEFEQAPEADTPAKEEPTPAKRPPRAKKPVVVDDDVPY